MPEHHNPLDPRDPYFVPFYFTCIDQNGKGGRGPQRGGGNGGCGCGCFLAGVFIVMFLLLLLNSH